MPKVLFLLATTLMLGFANIANACVEGHSFPITTDIPYTISCGGKSTSGNMTAVTTMECRASVDFDGGVTYRYENAGTQYFYSDVQFVCD